MSDAGSDTSSAGSGARDVSRKTWIHPYVRDVSAQSENARDAAMQSGSTEVAEGDGEPPIAFRGFVSPSTLPGYVRLYVDARLVASYEIPEEIVDHVEEETPRTPEDPWGKSVVWVKPIRPPDERPLIRSDLVPEDPGSVAYGPKIWPPPPPPPPPGLPK